MDVFGIEVDPFLPRDGNQTQPQLLYDHVHYEKNIKSPEDLDKLPEDERTKISNAIKRAVHSVIDSDEVVFYGTEFAELIRDYSPILEYIRKNGVDMNGAFDVALDLTAFVIAHSDNPQEVEVFLGKYLCIEPDHMLLNDLNPFHFKGLFKKALEKINPLHAEYIDRYELKYKSKLPYFYFINAAMEIKKRDYDLVVNVLTGGSDLGNLLEMAGANTRHLDCHRKDLKNTKWLEIGRNTTPPTQAKKVLITEMDTVTGKTLRHVVPMLRNLGAETVDVCFVWQNQNPSLELARDMSIFNNVIDIRDFSYIGLFEKLAQFQKILERALAD